MQKEVEIILKKLSLKHQLPEEIIKAIVESPYFACRQLVKQAVKNEPDTFLNIRLHHLGKLVANHNKIKRFSEGNGKR